MADSEANAKGVGTPGVHETSPDLLKNTPSNIARLEDVIEHCQGRQKYLAQTRSPSDGSDVRWYFCKAPLAANEFAAAIPRSEVVGKSEYFRFGMRDSLAIEAAFLQREEELLSLWWKEYAECSEGPRAQFDSKTKLGKGSSASSSEASASYSLCEVEEERVGVPVKGGLYEVDLIRRHCFPVYWNGENWRVLRGHWFARKGGLDWLPVREDVAEQLEVAYHNKVWHRRRFQTSGLFAARVDLQGSSLGLHALFTGEDDTWEAWLNVDPSGFSGIAGFTGNGIKLRRGYSGSHSPKPTQEELCQQKEEEMDDYCSQVPVRHLVFMVHGIGQRLEKSNLVDDVGNFRQITASLAERHLTSHQLGTQRVLFIPCQWRKGLKLSGEAAVDKCTLDGVRGLRVMLSATAHDVLYYMSPIYCQDIIDSVSNQLNRLYLKFLKRNPGYDGKVSIYGHSLGSVLSYDILCHQENFSCPFPMDSIYKEFFADEESPLNKTIQTSGSDSLTNLDDKNSNQISDTKEVGGQVDDSMMAKEYSVLEHDNVNEEGSSFVGNSVINDLGARRSGTTDLETRDGKEDEHQQIHNSNCAFSPLDTPDSVANEKHTVSCASVCDSVDKEETIKLLREEVDLLRARLTELESQSSRTKTNEKAKMSTVPEQPVIEKAKTKDRNAPKNYTPQIKYTKLEFKVDTFFAVGSPLGVFLALRNIRLGIGKGKEYWDEENITEEMPACRQMLNIFHPFDPVAYRAEPLVCKEYISYRPVIIPYHRGGRRLHIGFLEFKEDLATRSQAIMDHFDSLRARILTVCQSKTADKLEEGQENVEEREERSYGSLMIERLTGSKDGRIDHVLQDKTFEHPYLQAIGSHTNYWRDHDTALFILKHLYHDIPEDPSSSEESNGDSPKNLSQPHSWTDRGETTDEELPLTFSDKQMIRSFSAKAKRYLRKA